MLTHAAVVLVRLVCFDAVSFFRLTWKMGAETGCEGDNGRFEEFACEKTAMAVNRRADTDKNALLIAG